MMLAIHTTSAPAVIGAYSQAIYCNNMVYLSGQIPLDPIRMELCSEDIKEQIDQVFSNLSSVCKASGGELSHIVKLTVYLLDLTHAPLVNDMMVQYFNHPYPARSMIGVAALPRHAKIEADAIMVLPSTV